MNYRYSKQVVMRKSSPRTTNYRAGASRGPVVLATFRDQMADFARAERLRELRKDTHLSREKVAGEIGVTTKTLYSWENGGSIRWHNAQKLAAFYGVDPESLVSREFSEAVGVSESQLDRIEAKLDRLVSLLEPPEVEPLPGPPTELVQPPPVEVPKRQPGQRRKRRAAGS
jgi:transcriptional regulator with XRE-family HTH domain